MVYQKIYHHSWYIYMVAKKSLVASPLVIFDGHHILYTIHDDIFSDITFVFPVIFTQYIH